MFYKQLPMYRFKKKKKRKKLQLLRTDWQKIETRDRVLASSSKNGETMEKKEAKGANKRETREW